MNARCEKPEAEPEAERDEACYQANEGQTSLSAIAASHAALPAQPTRAGMSYSPALE